MKTNTHILAHKWFMKVYASDFSFIGSLFHLIKLRRNSESVCVKNLLKRDFYSSVFVTAYPEGKQTKLIFFETMLGSFTINASFK